MASADWATEPVRTGDGKGDRRPLPRPKRPIDDAIDIGFVHELVRAAPGFVAGYWVDPVDRQGFGFLLFETEEQALTATPPATTWSAPGVTILRTDVRRVAVAIP
jgi:hypothetical protein